MKTTATEQRKLRLRLLPDAGANPLAILSLQPKRADAVWTRREWTALCEHLHNGNPRRHFVMGFRDAHGSKRYVRSKRLPVDRAISWAWGTIAGTAKSPLSFAPYAQNDAGKSRWGGLDFDAHEEGQADRARQLALAAFRVLLNAPDLAVILETSGSGGWHVWAISPEFYDTREWVRLLKSVANTVGVPISDGVCEIVPPDSLPARFGRSLRAPGCWNPGTDGCSEIVWENTHTSLEDVLSGKSKTAPLISNDLQTHCPDIERNYSFSVSHSPDSILRKLGITETGTRNGKLSSLVGTIFHQVGRSTARRLAELQFRSKTVATNATEAEHMASFEKLWSGMAEQWGASLSEAEREAFKRLETDNERDAYRIIRNYARKTTMDGVTDFPIVRDNLAARLGITPKGAAWIRDKLARFGIVEKTADYVPNKLAARFRWLL